MYVIVRFYCECVSWASFISVLIDSEENHSVLPYTSVMTLVFIVAQIIRRAMARSPCNYSFSLQHRNRFYPDVGFLFVEGIFHQRRILYQNPGDHHSSILKRQQKDRQAACECAICCSAFLEAPGGSWYIRKYKKCTSLRPSTKSSPGAF